MIVTTTHSVEGRRITEHRGIVVGGAIAQRAIQARAATYGAVAVVDAAPNNGGVGIVGMGPVSGMAVCLG
ncbi:MAG: hypothetical protein Q8K20_11145 [Gemmobacter sp.]|nr:hypothetical protein [Gemmobacter sp.]